MSLSNGFLRKPSKPGETDPYFTALGLARRGFGSLTTLGFSGSMNE